MLTAQQREVAETAFDRNKRREAEINDALRQEQARHNAAVKNMQRLRALRLERDTKKESADRKPKVKRQNGHAAGICKGVTLVSGRKRSL